MKLLYLFSLLFFVIPFKPAFAYLDPGSGGALVYLVVSLFSAGIYYFQSFFLKIIHYLSSLWGAPAKSYSHSLLPNRITFYSEGKQYWTVFKSVIDELIRDQVQCVYLTSDKNDPGLTYQNNILIAQYIGKTSFATLYLNKLNAPLVVMTTPQLDVLMLKRSKKVEHYAHLIHAPVDIHTYRKFAFDYFDSVLCSNQHQINHIRFLETKRNTKSKLLLPTGLTYLDDLILNIDQQRKNNNIPVILFAPTWKEYSILSRMGLDFFTQLLGSKDENKSDQVKFKIIFRPHPQMAVFQPELLKAIENSFLNDDRLEIDKRSSNQYALAQADLLISDLSGIIWDFIFLKRAPVILTPTPMNLDGFEATDLTTQGFWEMELINSGKWGILKIGMEQISNIPNMVAQILSKKIDDKQSMDEKVISEQLFNYGFAGKVAAKQLQEILNSKAKNIL